MQGLACGHADSDPFSRKKIFMDTLLAHFRPHGAVLDDSSYMAQHVSRTRQSMAQHVSNNAAEHTWRQNCNAGACASHFQAQRMTGIANESDIDN
jgi:hypothetical protein